MDEPEPVRLPIEDSLDLHTFSPRDVRSVVEEYLQEAAAQGFREVRLIHGRGTGAQRAIVQSLLRGHPMVSRHFDAPPERGGWGATVVVLKGPPRS
jgi:DNA-nicking Smr family endonuclease